MPRKSQLKKTKQSHLCKDIKKCPEIWDYFKAIKQKKIRTNKHIKALVSLVEREFAKGEIYIRLDEVENYMSFEILFPFKLMPWEKCAFVLHNCVRKISDESLRWPDLYLYLGRGNGKNGYASFEFFCLMTPVNGIVRYDIDTCATAEDQAKTSFNDIFEMMDSHPEIYQDKWTWTKERIVNKTTKSVLRYRTNSPKSKQGLRSGMVYLDEIEEFDSWGNIRVFRTGLGKQKFDMDGNARSDPRSLMTSTNGDKRGGPLDKYLNDADEILFNSVFDNGTLFFIFCLDEKEEVHDSKNWIKANPSIDYFKSLKDEIEKEYAEYKKDPVTNSSFMSLRMNLPVEKKEDPVTSWENIQATNQELPPLEELRKMPCILGVDFTKTTDMAGACFTFRDFEKNKYYTVKHAWLCRKSGDWDHINQDAIKTFEMNDCLTVIDDVEIYPELIVEWALSFKFNIVMLAVDSYRWSTLREAFEHAGFNANDKELVKLVRPSDIMLAIQPINSIFVNHQLCAGDDPCFRWSINNTKLIPAANGNYKYEKIERRSRKNDLFMAYVHSMTCVDKLVDNRRATVVPEVWTF